MRVSRIIFVTGTDTGVGKTLLTALLLQHLRSSGVHALAMKPFCSGGRRDVEILRSIQGECLPEKQINPFYFSEPIAPLVAARRQGRVIRLPEVIRAVRDVWKQCECLLVEGSGGVLVPVGETLFVADLIAALGCETLVVARDKLGTINHTCLSVQALRVRGVRRLKVVLMRPEKPDASVIGNSKILGELLAPARVISLPHLGRRIDSVEAIRRIEKKIKKTLARIADSATFSTRSLEHAPRGAG